MSRRKSERTGSAPDGRSSTERMLDAYRQALSRNIQEKAAAASPAVPDSIYDLRLEPVRGGSD